MKSSISQLSKILLFASAAMLIISLFVPIWRIYLDAPQYPEGLSLQIWANAIAGDVDIINGLNHYIGMKTLHTEDFIEFTILPYILIFFVILFAASALAAKKKWLYIVFWAFVIFGIVAMVDFWFWEYDYGHNLDPSAAIKVPGQSYQPPLIGYKQLLNFGAFSVPDIGGWLFVCAGVLLLTAVLFESGALNRFRKKNMATALVSGCLVLLTSCNSSQPEPIALHKDACSSCKMSISDGQYGAEIITSKGRVYKFDDMRCLQDYVEKQGKENISSYYVHNFNEENVLIDATTAWYVHHDSIKSPMGGHIAAFVSREEADMFAHKLETQSVSFKDLQTPTELRTEEKQHHE